MGWCVTLMCRNDPICQWTKLQFRRGEDKTLTPSPWTTLEMDYPNGLGVSVLSSPIQKRTLPNSHGTWFDSHGWTWVLDLANSMTNCSLNPDQCIRKPYPSPLHSGTYQNSLWEKPQPTPPNTLLHPSPPIPHTKPTQRWHPVPSTGHMCLVYDDMSDNLTQVSTVISITFVDKCGAHWEDSYATAWHNILITVTYDVLCRARNGDRYSHHCDQNGSTGR